MLSVSATRICFRHSHFLLQVYRRHGGRKSVKERREGSAQRVECQRSTGPEAE
jgi:hypothetical protein